MKLYDYYRSSAAFRVRIALNIKGLEVEQESIHLRHKAQRSDAYLAVNPQGLVPTLVDDDGTVVTQSMAIIEYLEETRPDTPSLMPGDAVGRARVRAIAAAIACDIHPLNNLRVLRHIDQVFDTNEATRNELWYKHWIAEGMAGLENSRAPAIAGRENERAGGEAHLAQEPPARERAAEQHRGSLTHMQISSVNEARHGACLPHPEPPAPIGAGSRRNRVPATTRSQRPAVSGPPGVGLSRRRFAGALDPEAAAGIWADSQPLITEQR